MGATYAEEQVLSVTPVTAHTGILD